MTQGREHYIKDLRQSADMMRRYNAASFEATSLDDIADLLEQDARHREQAVQEAVAERDAGIAALETWRRGILEWLAHECGIHPDDLPNHLALQEIDNDAG